MNDLVGLMKTLEGEYLVAHGEYIKKHGATEGKMRWVDIIATPEGRKYAGAALLYYKFEFSIQYSNIKYRAKHGNELVEVLRYPDSDEVVIINDDTGAALKISGKLLREHYELVDTTDEND